MTTDSPPRCNRCHRLVPTGQTVAGYGVRCAARYGLTPGRKVRVRQPARTGGGEPVIDGWNELMEIDEEGERA